MRGFEIGNTGKGEYDRCVYMEEEEHKFLIPMWSSLQYDFGSAQVGSNLLLFKVRNWLMLNLQRWRITASAYPF